MNQGHQHKSAGSAPRLLLVTTAIEPSASVSGGRAMLSHLVADALAEILGSRLEVYRIAPQGLRGVRAVASALNGTVDGVDAAVVREVVALMNAKGIERVIFDGSSLGYLCRQVRLQFKDAELLTLFHNCEARFFYGAFRHYKSVRSLGVLMANFVAERMAVRYSHRLFEPS